MINKFLDKFKQNSAQSTTIDSKQQQTQPEVTQPEVAPVNMNNNNMNRQKYKQALIGSISGGQR